MSQDASTSLLKPTQDMPSDHLPEAGFSAGVVSESGGFPVESYADRLMDDLFEDVEEMLGGHTSANSDEVEQPEEPAPPAVSTFLKLPLTGRFRQPEVLDDSAIAGSALDSFSASERRSPLTTPVEPGQKPARSYDRLLLGVGCVSLITTLALWLLFQEANRPPVVSSVPAQSNAVVEQNANDQFAEYMQRSLAAIDQKLPPASSTVALGNVPPNSNLPTVTVPVTIAPGLPASGAAVGSTTSPVPQRTPTGLERVYSSIYNQLPQAGAGRSLSVPNVAPLPSSPMKTGSASVKAPLPLQVPGVARTLVGVVEMGDQSAILVEVNGVAQRFRLGESIGSSGWALVEVSKNQAIVRRNGEVRSVFIGQNF